MTIEPSSGARATEPLPADPAARSRSAGEYGGGGAISILLIANRTCPCPDVLEAVGKLAGEGGGVHIVAPALNSRLRHWLSDVDDAIGAARERLERATVALSEQGIEASGEIGDSDPLRAARDAVLTIDPDEVVVSTYPASDSNWLEQDLPRQLADALERRVTHLTSRFGLDEDRAL